MKLLLVLLMFCIGLICGLRLRLGDAPFLVYILRYERHVCGGTLISNRWVLTAAHCVHGVNSANIGILGGATNFHDVDSAYRKVKRIHIPESYSREQLYMDLALIRLEKAFNNCNVTPLKWFATGTYDGPAFKYGWHGRPLSTLSAIRRMQFQMGRTHAQLDLYVAKVTVLSNAACQADYVSAPLEPTLMCITGTPPNLEGHDTNAGLPYLANGEIVGIESHGSGLFGLPAIGVRTAPFLYWIEEVVTKSGHPRKLTSLPKM